MAELKFDRKYRPLYGEIITGSHFTNLTVRMLASRYGVACPYASARDAL